LDEEKSIYAGFAQEKQFCNCICALFAEDGKRRSKDMHLLENSVINMISLLLHVFDWPIIMIGRGGLLLVIPTYLQSHFHVYG
jgi:hypothetical protein